MLINEISFQVLNDMLEDNVFNVECKKSILNNKPTLYITTRQEIDYDDFLNRTKDIIPEDNISCNEKFSISVELDFRIIKEFTQYALALCNREYNKLIK